MYSLSSYIKVFLPIIYYPIHSPFLESKREESFMLALAAFETLFIAAFETLFVLLPTLCFNFLLLYHTDFLDADN